MMRSLLVALVLAAAPAAQAKKQTLDEAEWSFVYDDKKILSSDQMKLAVQLREASQLGVLDKDPLGELFMWSRKHSAADWASFGPGWQTRAREQLAAIRKRGEDLAQWSVPAELEPARAWYVRDLGSHLARLQAGVEYVEKQDAALLRKPEGAARCSAAVDKVVATTELARKWEALTYDWSNCVNGAVERAYPAAAWKVFLKKYGVKAKLMDQE